MSDRTSMSTNRSQLDRLVKERDVDCLVEEGDEDRERLFFEPGATSFALAEAESGGGGRESERGGSVALVAAMNSRDPFLDFRALMAEMVEGGWEMDWGFLVKMKNLIKTRNYHYTLS
ncbi:transcription repressor OFP13-like [Salvia hispanica]|uniref:transcription repressor OFP13-like n=1 Tax=Salvia hispanica TaxID=49212 RepID=UPI0020096D46|nr:transcription repressor OFP13-like [Salvia hispanica]